MPILNRQTIIEARRWVLFLAGLAGNLAYALFCILCAPAMILVLWIMCSK